MDQATKEALVYRIITGQLIVEVNDISYLIKTPGPIANVKAYAIYEDTIRKNRFDAFLTDQQCFQILLKHKKCKIDTDAKLQLIDKEIENLKCDLYENMFMPKEHTKTRNTLRLVREKQNEMYSARHSLDHLTLRGFAEVVKRQHIMFETTFYEDGSKVWENVEDVDALLLERIVGAVAEKTIMIGQLREIARTDPWRNFWNIEKGNPFGEHPTNLSDEQRTLVLFSKMYDAAYEHPDCPTEDVIKDDDLFDGWMISERRKQEKEKTGNQFEKKLNSRNAKIANADEVFIMVKDKEEAKVVEAQNDVHAMMIKKQREAVIKKKGKAVDANFPDRRMQIQQNVNEQFKQKVKGG